MILFKRNCIYLKVIHRGWYVLLLVECLSIKHGSLDSILGPTKTGLDGQ